MYSSVLVALDGSQLAAQALPHGAELARRLNVPLVLLRVLGPTRASPGQEALPADLRNREAEASRSQAEGYLEALRRATARGGLSIETRIEEGQATEAILRVVQTLPGVLLVITSSGRSASEQSVLGSVAEYLSREVTGSILVVKPERGEAA